MKYAYLLVITYSLFVWGCKGVSKYTIDEKPSIKIDTKMLGIWKAVEDTDMANFILIQNNYDVHHMREEYKCGSLNIYNNYYFITYMDHAGINPHFQQFSAFESKIKNDVFLNIGDLNSLLGGFIFIKLVRINATFDTITTVIVSDSTMRYFTSTKEVRNRIAENINNPHIYGDTLHFYKVSAYHESLDASKYKANSGLHLMKRP